MSCSKRYSLHKVNNVTDHEYTIFKPIIVAIKFPRNCEVRSRGTDMVVVPDK